MTPQETFDTVVAALRKQGVHSKDGDLCVYRGPHGMKCAVGHLIPDEQYDQSFEKETVEAIYYKVPALAQHDYNLLARLQSIHDCHPPSEWEREWSCVADDFGLTYKEAYETTTSPS